MSDSKVFMVPDGNNSIDPSLMYALTQNGGFGNGNWMWMMFMWILFPWIFNGNGYGMGGNSLSNQLNNTACEFAISKMDHGKEPVKKEKIDEILTKNSVVLEHNELYDYVYVYNMGYNDFLGNSITDEKHLAYYVKDVIDDEDGYDGIVFNRWYADTVCMGIPIEWSDMI